MTFDDEPLRWSEGGSDGSLERLIRVGRTDGPSARALQAAPLAVASLLSTSTAAAAVTQAGVGAAALSGKGAAPALVLLKWIAVGTLTGTSLMALTNATELGRTAPGHFERTPARAQSMPSGRLGLVQPPPSAAPASRLEQRGSSLARVPVAQRTDVAHEVALLDRARAALVAGDPAETTRLLDSLEQLPDRSLAPEATVLRVRALLARGERSEAQRLVDQFCQQAPRSPQAASLRSLLEKSRIQRAPGRL